MHRSISCPRDTEPVRATNPFRGIVNADFLSSLCVGRVVIVSGSFGSRGFETLLKLRVERVAPVVWSMSFASRYSPGSRQSTRRWCLFGSRFARHQA